jgi:hypothetical protein
MLTRRANHRHIIIIGSIDARAGKLVAGFLNPTLKHLASLSSGGIRGSCANEHHAAARAGTGDRSDLNWHKPMPTLSPTGARRRHQASRTGSDASAPSDAGVMDEGQAAVGNLASRHAASNCAGANRNGQRSSAEVRTILALRSRAQAPGSPKRRYLRVARSAARAA